MAIEEISVQDLHALGSDITLVDVREPDEWDMAHVSYAKLVPLATVPDSLEAFSGEPTYVICRSGGRSMRACEHLDGEGRNVVNVTGGMLAWMDEGFDVERDMNA